MYSAVSVTEGETACNGCFCVDPTMVAKRNKAPAADGTAHFKTPTRHAPITVRIGEDEQFACLVDQTSRPPRWVLFDSAGSRFEGPRYRGETTPDEILRVVERWWRRQRVTGQPSAFGARLQAWLKNRW